MSEEDALAVLEGKVQCCDCYLYAKNTMVDFAKIPRIVEELKARKYDETPQGDLGKCVRRVAIDRSQYIPHFYDRIPPRKPKPDKWRKCVWFIGNEEVISQGGGVSVGIFKAEEDYE